MKRDLDLIRDILLEIEKMPPEQKFISSKKFSNLYPNEATISLHIKLLDSGFINVFHCIPQDSNKDIYLISGLTSSGYDYLDSVRDSNIWNQTKEKLKIVGGTISLDIVKDVAVNVARSFLGV